MIAPSSYLFGFLIGRDRQRLSDTAAEVSRTWKKALSSLDLDGLRALRERIAAITGSTTGADRWIRIAEHLTGADYESALALLIEHNGAVMQSRGGAAPWVRIEKGRLDVRLQDEPRALPSRDDVPHLWESTYFLNALKLISVPLRGDSPRTLAA